MSEKVIPPDEKDWIEVAGKHEIKSYNNMQFSRIRLYFHAKKVDEVLLTVDFFDIGVVLKAHGILSEKKEENYFYLLLSDGCWVKGLEGEIYDAKADTEIRDKKSFLKLTISLKTADGIRRRIIRKEISIEK